MSRPFTVAVAVFGVLSTGAIIASAGGFVSYFGHYEDLTYYDDLRAVVMTSDGSWVLSGGWTGMVTTHTRDAATGALTYVDSVDVGYVADMVLSGDDRHLYVAGGYNDTLYVYSRDLATGALTWVDEYIDGSGGVEGLALTTAVAISPDSKHVYTCGGNGNGLVGFSRDGTTGELSLIEYFIDGQDGVDGINNPRGIVVSPDGAHVYVAGAGDDSIAIFSRDATSGALTYVGKVTDGANGVSGLASVYRLVLAGNGSHLYSGGTAVTVFTRDPGTGLLTYAEHHALGFSRGLALDKGNRHLYVSSQSGDSITVFDRNLATGGLTSSSTVTDGVDGVAGLDRPWPVTIDPQSRHAYVGCELDTLTVFQVGVFGDDFEGGDTGEWSSTVPAP